MRKRFKLTGFTLTELLVVVIVIGVLSAAVLPKFNKVIETRKTTEAEELMGSIRTEQEKRCALDKPYLTKMSELTDIVKKENTKNYAYRLENKGVIASSKGSYSYNLQMPSYADGRICCEGEDCEKLNKNYPKCEGFSYEPSPDSCAGTVEEPESPAPTPCEKDPTSCECNPNQEKCCSAGTQWNGSGCVTAIKRNCVNPKPDVSQRCNGCGLQEREVTCNYATGQWQTGDWGECSNTKEECAECTEGAVRGSQICNDCGTQTTEKCVSGKWVSALGSCTKTAQQCCTGTWDYATSKCVDCAGSNKWNAYACCPSGYKWLADKSKCCMPYPPTSGWVEERDAGCWKQECTGGSEASPVTKWQTGGAVAGNASGSEADWTAEQWCNNTLVKCAYYQQVDMPCYSVGQKCYVEASKGGYQPGSMNGSAYAHFGCSLLECKQTGMSEAVEPSCEWVKLF